VKTSLTLFLVLACASASAQAASYDCVAPVFPDHSTSNEGVRRIEKQVKQWRACKDSHRAEMDTLEADRLNAEVEANLGKWIAATRAYSKGQFNGRGTLTQMEHDKADYGMWMRGATPPPASARMDKM
jgi:hypothetical protein